MSSRIDIPLKPSAWVGFLAALPWLLLAVFDLVLTGAYGAVFLALLPVALAGAVYQWNRNGRLRLDRSIICLTITEGGLKVQQRNGEQYPVVVDPESRLYPQLMILKVKSTDVTYETSTMLLWANEKGLGNVSGDLHRQLRVWLRLGPVSGKPKQSH